MYDHRKRKELTMNQFKTALLRSRNLKGLVFLSPDLNCHIHFFVFTSEGFTDFLLIYEAFQQQESLFLSIHILHSFAPSTLNLQGQENQPDDCLPEVFCTPWAHGCPCVRLMDVRTHIIVFPRFQPGTPARMSPKCPRDIRPEKCLFGLSFRSSFI